MQIKKIRALILCSLLFCCFSAEAKSLFTITTESSSVKLATTGVNQQTFMVTNSSGVAQTVSNTDVVGSLGALFNASIVTNTCLGQVLNKNEYCKIKVNLEGKGVAGSSELDVIVCAFQGAVCSKLAVKVQVITKVLTCSEAAGKTVSGSSACWIAPLIEAEPFHCSTQCNKVGKNIQSPGPQNSEALASALLTAFNINDLLYVNEETQASIMATGILYKTVFKTIYGAFWGQQDGTDWNNPRNLTVGFIGFNTFCPCAV